MKSNFRRIARATKNEVDERDLQSDAWLIANEISEQRGQAVDFSDPLDQDLIIRRLHYRNVKRGDWKMRTSVRIEHVAENEDGSTRWIDRLAAAEASDPLVSLLRRESALDAESKLLASYSQATAYVRTLTRFKYDSNALCEYLLISNDVLSSRVKRAAATVRVQPSLFDGVNRIGKRFLPHPGKVVAGRTHHLGGAVQQGWDF